MKNIVLASHSPFRAGAEKMLFNLYLFSIYDLFELAEQIGARLHIQRDHRDPKENLKFELKIRGASEENLRAFDGFLTDMLPVGIENACFGDLRQVFCLVKQ